ncbi:MAG TPA: hypothetical protein VM120_21100 [Bryobacteraceae bacterium]|nr:hypothetical protein [Bryobacteraceae bacterium]
MNKPLKEQFYSPEAAIALARKTRQRRRIDLALGTAIAQVYAMQHGCTCDVKAKVKQPKRVVTTVTVTVEELF